MNLRQSKTTLTPKGLDELAQITRSKEAFLLVGARTSTVVPFELESTLAKIDVSCLPKEMKIVDGELHIEGPVSWGEGRSFCRSQGYELLAWPTEESAFMLGGLATSATGERSFGFGPIKDHVNWLEYMNALGEIVHLSSDRPFIDSFSDEESRSKLQKYANEYSAYQNFKNAPFPRFEKETDLMIGTEGQLGIITKASFKIRMNEPSDFIFINLPRWQDDYDLHIAFFEYAQEKRGDIYSLELMDENSMSYLPQELRPFSEGDILFMEVASRTIEDIYGDLLNIQNFHPENAVIVEHQKAQQIRLQIPRHINERNSRLGIVKKGTDAQVRRDKISLLLNAYRELSELGVDYLLFGHFGDAHLHFNFLPTQDQVKKCDEALIHFYFKIHQLKGTPFAEHGIGLIKQKFMGPFYNEDIKEVFYLLKKKYDPENKFFPLGFFGIKESE